MKNLKLNEILLLIVFVLCIVWYVKADAKPVRFMVIDTGVDTSHETIKKYIREPFTDEYVDDIGHGTAIASLALKDVCESVELISCKYFSPADFRFNRALVNFKNCLREAIIKQVDYINYSSSGLSSDREEYELLKKLTDKGVIITISMGNEGRNIFYGNKCIYSFPACYLLPNTYIIGNTTDGGKLWGKSNYGSTKNARYLNGVNVSVLLPKKQHGKTTGTSASTAKYMNEILKRKCWELRH